jgi:hypothetical protein
MKKSSIIILSIIFLHLTILAFGQVNNHVSANLANIPTKGYYAIGNNYKKLLKNPAPVANTLVTPNVNKGFYSLRDHNEKLAKQPLLIINRGERPIINKGYYSVRTHAKKLSNRPDQVKQSEKDFISQK